MTSQSVLLEQKISNLISNHHNKQPTLSLCVAKLQILVALSVQEPKTSSSVELNDTDVIVCKAPLNECVIFPVFASNNLIFLSAPPVANIVPVDEADIQCISASCTF